MALLATAGSLGYLSQTLSTSPGTRYFLSCWLNSPDGLTPNGFRVSWNGSLLSDWANIPAVPGTGWTNLAVYCHRHRKQLRPPVHVPG